MKPLIALVLATFLLLPSRAPVASDAADLAAVDASWNRLRLASDVAGLSALLLEDWVLTHSDGRVEDKPRYLADLRRGTRINHAIDNHDVQVRRHGDTAIVTGRTVQRGVGRDGPFQGEFRFTRVWILADGRWRMAASHSSRLPAQDDADTHR